MSVDGALLQPEAPDVEPASPTPAPRTLHGALGRALRSRGRLSGLAAWLLIAVAAVGFLASTPPSAGPDEPFQQATAWYLSGNGLAPDGTPTYSVPASLLVTPCFAFHQSVSAACMPAHTREMGSYALVLNYPPPYFWVVGAGERLAALVGLEYAAVGGRLASLLLNLGVLLLLTIYMRRRNPLWGNFLLLVSTPMAVFISVVVNPSGWEVTSALAMAVALSESAFGHPPASESNAWPKSAVAILVLTSIGLSTARPLGFVWAAGLTMSAIALAPSIRRRDLLRIVCAVAPGIALGAFWYRTHPYGVAAPVTVHNLVVNFVDTLMFFPQYIRNTFGDLGWLDTPIPGMLLLLNIAAWAALLTRLPFIRKAAMVVGVGGIVVVPCAISASVWNAWPLWWQGRYGMPFVLGFLLLLLLRSGRFIPRAISAVSAVSLLTLGIMVWVNEVRYGFGLDDFVLPVSLGTPGISPIRLVISAALGAVLVLVSGYLLLQARATVPDKAPVEASEPG